MAKSKKSKKRSLSSTKNAASRFVEKSLKKDVFEQEESNVDEYARTDIDGICEYEAPETFDHDSEIDEDEAFNSEDELSYGSFFSKKNQDEEESNDSASDIDDAEDGGQLLSDMLGTQPQTRLSTIDDSLSTDEDGSNDNEDDSSKHQNLLNMVDSLVSEKSKKKRHSHTDVQTEIGRESIYGVDRKEDDVLSMDALVNGNDDDEYTISSTAKEKKDSALLSAPMAKTQEARVTRKVAYDLKKKDVSDTFQATVTSQRRSDHLDFKSMQLPPRQNLSNAALSSKFKPKSSGMEAEVALLLNNSRMDTSKSIKDAEEEEVLKHADISKEEVERRQKELSRMRSLMFYEEQKARRVKKIKSKLYHKIRNKQKQNNENGDEDMDDEEQEKALEKRAQERMTLKHTNTSKWVQRQLKRGTLVDQNTRQAIADQLKRGEDLRKKIDRVSDGSDDDEDNMSTQEQASALLLSIEEDKNESLKQEKLKGLNGMKFMKKAIERQREKAHAETKKLLRELQADTYDSDNEKEEEMKPVKKPLNADEIKANDDLVKKKLDEGQGYQVRSVMMNASHSIRVDGSIKINLDDTSKDTKSIENKDLTNSKAIYNEQKEIESDHIDNPWLSSTEQQTKRKSNRKEKSKKDESSTTLKNNLIQDMEILKKEKNIDDSKKETLTNNDQAILVERAFAIAQDATEQEGESEIAQEKLKQIQDKKKSNIEDDLFKHGSGWGSWAGVGVVVSAKKRKRIEEQEMEKKLKQEREERKKLKQRKDSSLKKVVINPKVDKKLATYKVASVPYPFTSMEQYQLAMKNPLGSEWQTTRVARELSRPKIEKKTGTIITPLHLTQKQVQNAKEKQLQQYKLKKETQKKEKQRSRTHQQAKKRKAKF